MSLRIPSIALVLAACLPASAIGSSHADDTDPSMELLAASDDYRLIIGAAAGIVRFDVKAKVTDKERDIGFFVDLEGNLDLEEESSIKTLYGAYRFDDDHSLLFAYFDIDRRKVYDLSDSYEDLLAVNASLEIRDESRFYYVSYGYSLVEDDKSKITLIAGLHAIDLRFSAEARGDLTVEEETESARAVESAEVFAPLPLLGLNFRTYYSPEWSVSTRVSVVGGTYQDVTAGVLQAMVYSRYQFSKHVGLLLGIAYFSAEVDIEDSEELTEVSYGYEGAFLGLHLAI